MIKNTPGNETLNYYKDNADAFFEGTVSADMSYSRERFLKKLPAGARLLDLGCGSGRDTKAFLELGYSVDAVDGSEELCRRASEYTGIQVRCMLFQDLAAENAYDGIWACASLLHLPRKELAEVFCKVRDALKPGGVLYTGFKYGTFEGMRTGRYYTDFTEDTFREFMSGIEGLAELEHWITSDVRPGRDEEKWFNILLRRSGT